MNAIWRVSKYGFHYPWLFGGAYVMNVATTLSALAIPPLIGNAIDRALGSGSQMEVLFAGLAILGAGVLRGVCGYMQIYLTGWMTGLVERDLQVRLLDKLQHLSCGFHDRHRTGDLMSRATADVDAVGEFIHRGLIQTTRTALWFGVVAVIMLATNWQLALIAMAFLPLSTWVLGSLSIKADEARSQVKTGKMTAVLQESIVGMRLARAFGAGDHERARFRSASAEVTDSNYRAYRVEVSHVTLSTYLFVAAVGALLWFGAREVVFGRLTEGELAMFLLYMALLREPVRTTGWIVAVFAAARASGRRLFEILDAESPVPERPAARRVARAQGRVAFEGVSFSYDSGSETLHDVGFEVRAGQTVALLGAPGSGKTSIVHLVPRFYDATSGRVTVDGVDVRDLRLTDLRRNIGIVLQDVFIFGASFTDNISYGTEGATDEEIREAARVAQLRDFIESLPDKYETWVGERGVKLSGGQRQRLAIARTILLDPAILILDDSTSSVDVETEHKLQQALAEVIKGRTTFVIAHRLSTVRNADLILVMDRGRVAERGTHAELLERGRTLPAHPRPPAGPPGHGRSSDGLAAFSGEDVRDEHSTNRAGRPSGAEALRP